MLLKKSPLVLKQFYILNSEYTVMATQEGELPASGSHDLPIEADYIIKIQDNFFHLFTKVQVNKEGIIPGYKLMAEAVSIFAFNDTENLSKEQKLDLLHRSGLSMTINALRVHLMQLTSMAPLGKYIFPSIDITALLREKAKLVKKTKASSQIKNQKIKPQVGSGKKAHK